MPGYQLPQPQSRSASSDHHRNRLLKTMGGEPVEHFVYLAENVSMNLGERALRPLDE
jgi:hypothetical protein